MSGLTGATNYSRTFRSYNSLTQAKHEYNKWSLTLALISLTLAWKRAWISMTRAGHLGAELEPKINLTRAWRCPAEIWPNSGLEQNLYQSTLSSLPSQHFSNSSKICFSLRNFYGSCRRMASFFFRFSLEIPIFIPSKLEVSLWKLYFCFLWNAIL